MKTRLILVGGFLGAGKTTLLWSAAERLTRDGHAVGLITNDQAPDLVDTVLLSRGDGLRGVREVAGSCFCCNFPGFISAVESLIEQGATTIIAEPVGSCTDLSATILQPLKERYPDITLAPFTVLVDPLRFQETLERKFTLLHADARYILQLQMREADRILINKSDTLTAEQRTTLAASLGASVPGIPVGLISARTGEGLDQWLEFALSASPVGQRVVEVDYDRYAHGEAVLGWLNAAVDLRQQTTQAPWGDVAQRLMNALHAALKAREAEIGHLKLVIETAAGQCTANLTTLDGTISLNGGELTGPESRLTLNARVQLPPEELEHITRDALSTLKSIPLAVEIRTMRCLMPGRPNPTYRYDHVVRSAS